MIGMSTESDCQPRILINALRSTIPNDQITQLFFAIELTTNQDRGNDYCQAGMGATPPHGFTFPEL